LDLIPLAVPVLLVFGALQAEAQVREGVAEAAAFAWMYLPNPHLLERFRRGAALAPSDLSTDYGGRSGVGNTDYAALDRARAAPGAVPTEDRNRAD